MPKVSSGLGANSLSFVTLVEWNWVGHHPTYFAYFILALEELGVDVLAICPNPDEARQTVAKLRQQCGLSPGREGQTVYRQVVIQRTRFHGVRPARISAIDWTIRHFRCIEGLAKQWQAESGRRLGLIFYACIYDQDFDWIHWAQPFLSLPWAGLYLQALSLRMPGRANPTIGRLPRPEKMFGGRLCKGVAILDEGMAARFAEVTGKKVVVFPDLTDERMPGGASGGRLADRLKRFAGGRPIIGLFGFLQKSKGILTLALASQHPSMSEACFAVGGEMFWGSLSRQETETLGGVLTDGENVWCHLMRIPDGEQLNGLMAACDIIYAAYTDFPHSSNIMTKAALLKKPIIVSDGYLMAERVRRFRMGEIIPQGDVDALAGAITRITSDPKAWEAKNQPRWPEYCCENSFERLKEVFGELLGAV